VRHEDIEVVAAVLAPLAPGRRGLSRDRDIHARARCQWTSRSRSISSQVWATPEGVQFVETSLARAFDRR
jgi:hypothetical protein